MHGAGKMKVEKPLVILDAGFASKAQQRFLKDAAGLRDERIAKGRLKDATKIERAISFAGLGARELLLPGWKETRNSPERTRRDGQWSQKARLCRGTHGVRFSMARVAVAVYRRAMPRERDPDEPKIYFLPNLMTACNLACGFFAVLMIFKGLSVVEQSPVASSKEHFEIVSRYYEYAILLIFGSCIFDLLDGRLARLGGKESPFGREFDSLADIISFGMAPAMLLSRAVLFPLGNIGWGIALIYLVCGALRLAKFNCLAALPRREGDTHDFRGLPIPMAAGFIASLTFLLNDFYQGDRELGAWKFVLAGAMLLLSWLMVSDIRYPSFKKVGWKTRGTLGAIVIGVVLIFMTIQFRYVMPVVLFSAYLVYGLCRPYVSQRLRREIEIEDEDDPEDDPANAPPPHE